MTLHTKLEVNNKLRLTMTCLTGCLHEAIVGDDIFVIFVTKT